MIGTIKLTKRLIDGQNLIITPDYVSNGHWLARRAVFKNGFVLADPKEALGVEYGEEENSYVERVLPKQEELIRLARTGWFIECYVSHRGKAPYQFQLFATKDNLGMFFNKVYVDGFGIETLWAPISKGDDPSLYVSNGPSIDAPTWDEAHVAIMHARPPNAYKILGHELPTVA